MAAEKFQALTLVRSALLQRAENSSPEKIEKYKCEQHSQHIYYLLQVQQSFQIWISDDGKQKLTLAVNFGVGMSSAYGWNVATV